MEECVYSDQHGGVVSSQHQGLRFDPDLTKVSVCEFKYAPLSVPVGFLWVLRFPPTSQKCAGMWICCAKLPLNVKVCVHRLTLLLVFKG